MYEGYFGLIERPFSIAPDPHYLYMSARHKEATAHLSYGLSQGGCFIVLTGEVGTGKTTLCRNLLSDLPENVDVALILNANINESELLQTVCDELKIAYTDSHSQKQLLDLINQHLLSTFADNRHTVLIIDEAQLLSRDVLEQVRLLTNLETTKSKLLQIILIGQPELNDLLSRNDLRQLAQRVTARYHLGALERSEIEDYVNFRLSVAGCKQPLFSRQALNKMHSLTGGIPRKINVLADHALLATYSKNQSLVDAKTIKRAAQDVFIDSRPADRPINAMRRWWLLAGLFLLINVGAWWLFATPSKEADVDKVVEPSNPINVPSADKKGEDDSVEVGSAGEASLSQAKPPSSALPAAELEPTLQSEPKLQPQAEIEQAELEPVKLESIEPEDAGDKAVESQPKNDKAWQFDTALTNINTSEETQPGTVVVADEYLDASVDVAEPPLLAEQKVDIDGSVFGRVLETSADVTGRSVATRTLAKQWGIELPTPMLKPSCKEVTQQGLGCIAAFTWRQLMRYNRPAMLTLSHQNQFHRVVLVGINGDIARVLVGDDVYRLPIGELRQRWEKKATLYWRPSPAGGRFLQLGDEYPELSKTRAHLNSALSNANMPILENVDSTIFGIEMSQKVFALQTRFGISGDSKIGYETYLLMNELVTPSNVPVLTNRLQ